MSGRFPVVTGQELVRALEKLGFFVKRQKGSHVSMYRELDKRRTTVPVHKGVDLPGGTLRGILKDVDVSPEQLREVL
jgi:predicted RNA binding protein YcfA (HicA-like mRNA interferase family)